MAKIDDVIDTSGYSSTVRKVLLMGKNGTSRATVTNPVPVDAVVTVDSMSLEAEMKVNSGHDLYTVPVVSGTAGTIVFTWPDIVGFTTLQTLQGVENKTQGWIYNTGDATITSALGTTTLTLLAASQKTGYPTFTAGDLIEVVYRGTSRLTDKTQMSRITDGTTEVVVETAGTKKALNVNVTDGTNDLPTMDANTRAGFVKVTDGTTEVIVETDGTKKALNVNITDGTNDMPTMDANTRAGFVQLTDGTDEIDIKAGNTMAVADKAVPVADANVLAALTANSFTDDSNDFTIGTSDGNVIMGVATADVVDAGDVGAIRMSVNRNLGVDISEQSLTAVKVSADANANLVTNPIFTEITDGTTGVAVTAGLTALKVDLVGEGGAAIDATNPVFTQLTDGTTSLTSTTVGADVGLDVHVIGGLDVAIGAVELKNGATDDRALITAANTARVVGDMVLSVQEIGADGTVKPTGSLNTNAPFVKITDGVSDLTLGAGATKTVPAELNDGTTKIVFGTDAIKTVPVKISDGTTNLGISLTGNAGVNIAEQTLTAVKISKDASANGVSNAVYTQLSDQTTGVNVIVATNALKTDTSSVAGTATSVNKGATDAGTQRIEIASNAPQAYGEDATGADGYATILTTTAIRTHMDVTNGGSNAAVISVDAGTTDHFVIPGNSSKIFDNVFINTGVAIQAKNKTAGQNYTNLTITVW